MAKNAQSQSLEARASLTVTRASHHVPHHGPHITVHRVAQSTRAQTAQCTEKETNKQESSGHRAALAHGAQGAPIEIRTKHSIAGHNDGEISTGVNAIHTRFLIS